MYDIAHKIPHHFCSNMGVTNLFPYSLNNSLNYTCIFIDSNKDTWRQSDVLRVCMRYIHVFMWSSAVTLRRAQFHLPAQWTCYFLRPSPEFRRLLLAWLCPGFVTLFPIREQIGHYDKASWTRKCVLTTLQLFAFLLRSSPPHTHNSRLYFNKRPTLELGLTQSRRYNFFAF